MNTIQRNSKCGMSTLWIGLVFITLSGCASSMNELVAETSQSDDWKALNKQIDSQEIAPAEQQSCGSRHALFCETVLGETSCSCVANEAVWNRTGDIAHRQRGNRR